MNSKKKEIIDIFNKNVKGKKANTTTANAQHDGKEGHWLEQQMGIKANASNSPDLLGYEMKNDTKSKTTFGDWSANYYIFKDKKFDFSRSNFLSVFGKSNIERGGRHSWSGEPCPKVNTTNKFGQKLTIDKDNNISAIYNFSADMRANKKDIVPSKFQIENLTLARWDSSSLREKLEQKFKQNGWFKCLKDNQGIYYGIAFGKPICFEQWIEWVKKGDVFFDSGMYDGNSRNYSQWRANNKFWDNLIYEQY